MTLNDKELLEGLRTCLQPLAPAVRIELILQMVRDQIISRSIARELLAYPDLRYVWREDHNPDACPCERCIRARLARSMPAQTPDPPEAA